MISFGGKGRVEVNPIVKAALLQIADELERETGPMAGILSDCEVALEQCRAAVAAMRADVFERGQSATVAMEQRPELFPREAVEAIRAGEKTGNLASAFRAAAKTTRS